MAWSTRQLADLTGVTLRSIRHWHDVGLLPAPERLSNGYKQYTAQQSRARAPHRQADQLGVQPGTGCSHAGVA